MAGGVDSRAEEYKNRVLALDHVGLLEMWELLYGGTPLPGWPPGKALEYLILRAFQLEGAEVTWPYCSGGGERLIGHSAGGGCARA